MTLGSEEGKQPEPASFVFILQIQYQLGMATDVSADRCCIAHMSPAWQHHVAAALSPLPQYRVAVLELGSVGVVRAAEWCYFSASEKL